jgi:hypothetical protein
MVAKTYRMLSQPIWLEGRRMVQWIWSRGSTKMDRAVRRFRSKLQYDLRRSGVLVDAYIADDGELALTRVVSDGEFTHRTVLLAVVAFAFEHGLTTTVYPSPKTGPANIFRDFGFVDTGSGTWRKLPSR